MSLILILFLIKLKSIPERKVSTEIQTIDQAAYQSFAINLIELKKYIEDPDITEIMVNSPTSIRIENSRGMERVEHNLGGRLDVAINNLSVLTEISKVKAGTESVERQFPAWAADGDVGAGYDGASSCALLPDLYACPDGECDAAVLWDSGGVG